MLNIVDCNTGNITTSDSIQVDNWTITASDSTTGGIVTPLTTDGVTFPYPYDGTGNPWVIPTPNVTPNTITIDNTWSGALTFNTKKMVKFVKLVILKEVRDEEDFIVDYEFVTEQVIKVGPKTKEIQFAIMKQVKDFDPETMIYQEVWSVQRELE